MRKSKYSVALELTWLIIDLKRKLDFKPRLDFKTRLERLVNEV